MSKFPTIDVPLYDAIIPSTNKRIKLRPMTVKEEKILLMEKESGDKGDVLEAIKQIVNNCILDKTVKVNKLAIFDIEYLFIKIRAISVSNKAEMIFNDNEDGKNYKFEIDLDKVAIVGMPTDIKAASTIKINDKIAIVMKYPSGEIYSEAKFEAKTDIEMLEIMVNACIDKIFDGEKSYTLDDVNPEELSAFVETLDITTYNKMREFIEASPTLHYEIVYTNAMGKEQKIVLDKLADFFQLR